MNGVTWGGVIAGHLVQTVTIMTDREIVDSIDNRMEEWTEHAREYCASTGSKVDYSLILCRVLDSTVRIW